VCVEVKLLSVEYVFVCVFVSVSACVAPLSGECIYVNVRVCVCICSGKCLDWSVSSISAPVFDITYEVDYFLTRRTCIVYFYLIFLLCVFSLVI
jgi:hypothetical protein